MRRRRNLLSIGAVGSNSRSLGGNDPRIRRNSTQLGASDVVVTGPVKVDKKQRLTIAAATGVNELEEGATSEQIQERLNLFIKKMTSAGFVQGGA